MKKILVIRYSALGDLVTLEPFFRALRYFFPKDDITFLTTSIGKSLYEDTNYFDDYILSKNSYGSVIDTLKQIDTYYDMVFNLQCSSTSHILSRFIKKSILINSSRSFLQKIFKLPYKTKTHYQILQIAGIDKSSLDRYYQDKNAMKIKLPYSLDNKTIKSAKEKFNDRQTITIGIGASPKWESKKWGIKNYEKLIKLLINEYGIVLIGSSLEEKECKVLSDSFPQILNLTAKTDLNNLKSLLGYTDLYIGNDSGPTHIAAAVGCDTLTIFGSTDIKHCPKFGNYDGIHRCIKPDSSIKCHPCYKPKCPTNLECMQNITPQKVYQIAKEALG